MVAPRRFPQWVATCKLGACNCAVLMLKAYLDRGAKQEAATGVMCITAALFDPFRYDQFLHAWQPFLDGWRAAAFHATDFYTGAQGSPFFRKRPDGSLDPDREARYNRDSKLIPHIIGRHVRELFVITFRPDEFIAMAPAAWREQFGSLHRVAAQMMLGRVGYWADQSNYQGEIKYFYETGDEDEAAVHDAYVHLYADVAKREQARMASIPVGVEKGNAHGLEVADFLAWHWNKWYIDTYAPTKQRRPMRKDIEALLKIEGLDVHVTMVMGQALEHFLIAHGCRQTRPR